MPKVNNCPHCNSKLLPHEGVNEEFTHCNTCGCCFVQETGEQRPGHPVCKSVAIMAVIEDTEKDAYEAQIKTLQEIIEQKDDEIAKLSLPKETVSTLKEAPVADTAAEISKVTTPSGDKK
jgi:hypothetical protein